MVWDACHRRVNGSVRINSVLNGNFFRDYRYWLLIYKLSKCGLYVIFGHIFLNILSHLLDIFFQAIMILFRGLDNTADDKLIVASSRTTIRNKQILVILKHLGLDRFYILLLAINNGFQIAYFTFQLFVGEFFLFKLIFFVLKFVKDVFNFIL